ncbi:MAG: aldo/keto reductase [Planctomycetes bacterium]|nr:aldo/keto reductase [Planctomycetota bacterium]
MIYKTYGQTGIEVSAVGFGAMRFDDNKNLDVGAELVKNAYDKGINYFDTAPLYVDDKSEIIVGMAIKEMNKTRAEKPFYVSTKSSKATPGEVRENIESSLKRLNVDYIDFYHFWCIITLEQYEERKANGVLKEFEKLKEEGLIKHICVSTHLVGGDIEKMLGDYPFDGILLGYSIMNFPYREVGVDAAAKSGKGLVIMNPLGGGVIPQNPELFDFVKTQSDETVVEASLRFLINDPRITVALVGFGNQKHLDEALRAVDGFKPIDGETVGKIKDSLQENFNDLCTSCQYCDDCPQDIAIPKIMDIYNHYKLGVGEKDIMERLMWHWGIKLEDNNLGSCTHCGNCEPLCTQKLPICERIEFVKNKIDAYLEKQKAKQK